MKFRATFKTPDAVEEPAAEAAAAEARRQFRTFDPPESAVTFEEVREDLLSECDGFAKRFVRYGELVTIEFDTVAETATVIPAN